ncbi:MAG: EAL domain-containing protein [Treponema sp.]|nr:EAL domain-containing protein [Treponema sp.]
MLLVKYLYTVLISFLMIGLLGNSFYYFFKKGRAFYAISYIHLTSFFTIFCFFLTLFVKNQNAAEILLGLYYASMSYAFFWLQHFLYNLEDNLPPKEFKYRLSRIVYVILVFVDTLLLVLNFRTGWSFTTEPIFLDGLMNEGVFSWEIKLNWGFLYHGIICGLMDCFILKRVIQDIFTHSKFYRFKFVVFFVVFMTLNITNPLYMFFSAAWKLDYSLFVNAFLALVLSYFSHFTIPNQIQKQMLSIASENISDAVICYDKDGNCLYENKLAREFPEEIKQQWKNEYLEKGESFLQKGEVLETSIFGEEEEPLVDKRYFNVEFRRVQDSKNRYSGCYLKFYDCTSEVHNMEREEYRATHDELTGLYNRNFFFSEMERIIKEKPDLPRYLICTNIKDFKLINDLFGSSFSDSLLKNQAEMLLKANFDGCILGRISADHFAMLIPKERFNPDLAVKNTERVKEFSKDIKFKLQIVLGVYEITNPYENVHTMYDKACLAVKNVREDCTTALVYYDSALMKKLMDEKNIISEFKYALVTNQFCMFLQPQIDAHTDKVIGAEALVRWYDINKGYRAPREFIQVLEDSGLIYQLDYYVWEKAVQKLSQWQSEGLDTYISINISVKDFYYGNIYDYLTALVEQYKVPPSKLNIEITESFLFGDSKLHKNIISKLRDYGFKIEMDDFGSGYSSLTTLKELPMDVLKIDMAFLQKTENLERSKIIISCIVQMARNLGMTIVTEGVETQEQADFLKQNGVDILQGYLYSHPIPPEEFEHKYLEVQK